MLVSPCPDGLFLLILEPDMRRIFIIWLFFFSGIWRVIYGQSPDHWETVVYNDDLWRYFVGIQDPVPDWNMSSFEDSIWAEGRGGFGYGDNDDNTIIPACISVYIRRMFNLADTGVISSAILNMDYDDAFVAYLNGVEIARAGISVDHPSFDQTGDDHEAAMYRGLPPEYFTVDKDKLKSCLLPGANILAVEVHNSTISSSDLSSNVFLSFGITDTTHNYRPVPSWFTLPVDFSSSGLPVVVINTDPGETIPDEPKINADMKIIFHGGTTRNRVSDPGNVYSGKIGIEIRGKYSASLPQKPFGFETRDSLGNNLNTGLLGMPPENDWILLANYNDKTFLRNYLAFEIFRETGHYAPRSRYCEVVLNGSYQGIYLLTEKIKIDENRVNISKLRPDENSGDNMTGGYIFKIDYYTPSDSWMSNYSPIEKPDAQVFFVYYDPKPDELTTYQKNYLKDYVNTFEAILYSPGFADSQTGYRAYIDVPSFIDYFLVGEVSRNVDTYKKSRYLYKNRDSRSGRLFSGPVWDFDWAWKNLMEDCINFNQTDGSGWAYKINDCYAWPVPPSWEMRFLQDESFRNEIHDKYYILRKSVLSETHINHLIDSVALLLNEAQERHYQKWPILGINVGTPEPGIQPDTYSGEIDKFKNWISTRLTWLDKNMIGRSDAFIEGYMASCRIFPNPAEDYLNIESDTIINRVILYNISGVMKKSVSGLYDYSVSLNLVDINPGFYLVRIFFSDGEILTRRIIKNR
jgi:hypothetical protein